MLDTVAAERAALTANEPRLLRYGVARAALASGLAESVSRVLTIVLSIATARALQPGQVGILGLAVIVIGIISLIAACSETAGVISHSEGTDSQHAFAATVIRGLITISLVIAAYLCLPVMTRLLAGAESSEVELNVLIRILLFVPLAELVATYPRVLLQRRLDLTYVAGVSLFQVICHVSLSVALLWKGFGANGVAWSSLICTILSAIGVWLRITGSRWPKWSGLPTARLQGTVLTSTSKVFVGGFVGYLNGRVDNLLVANAIGPTAMSFYGMAWSASRVAPQILGQALGFVLVPALARIRTDKQRVGRALNESVRHSYLLLAPVAAGLFVSAPSLVTTVLGSKWLPMVPCLRVMCVSVLTVPFIQACSALLIGTGLAHLSGIAATIHLLVLIVLVRPLALNWGILGAAFADLVGVVALTSSLFFISRLKARGVAWEFSSLAMPITAALGAGFITWWVGSYVSVGLVRLLLEASVVIAAYVLAISVLGGRSRLNDVTNLLRGVMRRGMAQPDAGR